MGNMLLIEGHRLIRGALENLLAHNGGMQMTEATDPIDGIQQAVSQLPDVIILDTAWTEINGFWLARLLHKLSPLSKIVLLLDDNHPVYQEAARANGADAFVAKQMLTTELLPTLERFEVFNSTSNLVSSSMTSDNKEIS